MAPGRSFPTLKLVLAYLRLFGIANAAIWFGAAVFFTWWVEPAFTSPEIARILPPSHAGATAQVLLERYFVLHCWCGGLALAHLLVEWLYSGRPLRRWAIYLVLCLLAWGLTGHLWLQPELQRLHLEVYGVRSTPPQRQLAAKSFRVWHGVAEAVNIAAGAGLLVFLLRIAATVPAPRFLNGAKFKS